MEVGNEKKGFFFSLIRSSLVVITISMVFLFTMSISYKTDINATSENKTLQIDESNIDEDESTENELPKKPVQIGMIMVQVYKRDGKLLCYCGYTSIQSNLGIFRREARSLRE